MILKVCKKETKESNDGKTGSIEVMTEFHNADSFTIKDGKAISDKNVIFISDYEQIDEIDGSKINYKIEYAFLMNDNGQTIERLV